MISLFSIIISFMAFFLENGRLLKVTEFQLAGLDKILKLEEQFFENPYTESFVHNFKDSYVVFNLENHSKSDMEIYGFYLEIQVDDLPKKILVPLEAKIKGEEDVLSVFLSGWSATSEIDKYVIKENSAIEVYASLEETCRDLTHIWFLDSGLCERSHSISKKLENTYSHGRKIKCKYRIVCKDTFGKYYYSASEKVEFLPETNLLK